MDWLDNENDELVATLIYKYDFHCSFKTNLPNSLTQFIFFSISTLSKHINQIMATLMMALI